MEEAFSFQRSAIKVHVQVYVHVEEPFNKNSNKVMSIWVNVEEAFSVQLSAKLVISNKEKVKSKKVKVKLKLRLKLIKEILFNQSTISPINQDSVIN